MKKLTLLALSAVLLTSCWTTIRTVAPTVEPVAPVQTVYTTTVTTPAPKTTTVKTVTVTNYNADMSFYLDLNAVAAAFAESHSIQDFEQLLNSSRYMINNLDLNRDGWIDYLRVIETCNGYYHALLIQACLAPGVFQDVATLVAERRPDVLYVEVIGDRYLYGYNYIVRPVFVKRPPMWDIYGRPVYTAWSSPYYYGHFPSYYTQPKPIYLNHYQAYVTTYMTNHHYCHHCDYPSQPYYSGYTSMTKPHTRNDYYRDHPSESFDNRVTRTIGTTKTGGVSVRNTGQLRNAVAAETNKSATKTESSSSSSSSRGTSTVSASTGSSSASGNTRGSGSSSSTSTSVRGGSSASNSPSGSSNAGKTESSSSSSSSRGTSTVSANTGSSSASGSSTSANRGTGSSVRSTDTKASTKKPESTKTQDTQTTKRQPTTSVDTRVNKSGTTRTTIKTTDSTGRTTTIKRESSNSSNRSTGSSTRSSSTSTRSSSTSTRSSQGPSTESSPRSDRRGR